MNSNKIKAENRFLDNKSKWNANYIWRVYKYMSLGMTERAFARKYGLAINTIYNWQKKFPSFNRAIKAGKRAFKKPKKKKPRKVSEITNLNEFIYGKLPDHLKETWEYIMDAYDGDPSIDITKMDEGLDSQPLEARQALFLHAWYKCNFSIVGARRMLNITKATWEKWKDDPVFTELFKEMDIIKSDFFESAMVEKVKQGNVVATVAANEAFNKDKYGKVVKVDHGGQIEHLHAHVVVMADLDLSVSTRKEILRAVRKQKAISEGEELAIEI